VDDDGNDPLSGLPRYLEQTHLLSLANAPRIPYDELVFDFPRGTGPEPWKTNLPKVRRIQGIMERCGDGIGVPTPVGLEYHESSWAEGVTL
jgi:hypothetical protein